MEDLNRIVLRQQLEREQLIKSIINRNQLETEALIIAAKQKVNASQEEILQKKNLLVKEAIASEEIKYRKRKDELLAQTPKKTKKVEPIQKIEKVNSENENKKRFVDVDIEQELLRMNLSEEISAIKRKEETEKYLEQIRKDTERKLKEEKAKARAERNRKLLEKLDREKFREQIQEKEEKREKLLKEVSKLTREIEKSKNIDVRQNEKIHKADKFDENANQIQKTFMRMVSNMATSIRDKLLPQKAKKQEQFKIESEKTNIRQPQMKKSITSYSRPKPPITSYDRLRNIMGDRNFKAHKAYLTTMACKRNDFRYMIGNGMYEINHPLALRRAQKNSKEEPKFINRYI